MTVMRSVRAALLLPALVLPIFLAGCNVWQDRAEFAPPQSRWPKNTPSPVAADATPPAIRTVHCYRTLAVVDCFPEKQVDRTGYMGAYPGAGD
jgi:hypothetical protein